VKALRDGVEPDLEDPFLHGPEIEIGLAALIPEDYMPDVHMRLVHYKRIANAANDADLDELQIELIDRFGLLPPPLKTLFAITSLKLLAQRLGVAKIQAGAEGGSIRFAERSKVDPIKLIKLIEGEKERYKLDGPYKLRFSWRLAAPEQRVQSLEKLLGKLAPTEKSSAAA
ncbi:MAG TPA: TRCF domain-containing protein, partial [Gammaproteobacteria bacterium]|nr:TRCF domain-containing protein [Gammaproteobacteria bacterium]